jgi:hypothetical protein
MTWTVSPTQMDIKQKQEKIYNDNGLTTFAEIAAKLTVSACQDATTCTPLSERKTARLRSDMSILFSRYPMRWYTAGRIVLDWSHSEYTESF